MSNLIIESFSLYCYVIKVQLSSLKTHTNFLLKFYISTPMSTKHVCRIFFVYPTILLSLIFLCEEAKINKQ